MKWITPHKYPSSFTGCRGSLTKMSVFWSEARNLDLGVWKPLFCLHKKHILKHVMFNRIEFLFSALQFLDLPEVHFYSHLLGLINSTVSRCRPEDQYQLVPVWSWTWCGLSWCWPAFSLQIFGHSLGSWAEDSAQKSAYHPILGRGEVNCLDASCAVPSVSFTWFLKHSLPPCWKGC